MSSLLKTLIVLDILLFVTITSYMRVRVQSYYCGDSQCSFNDIYENMYQLMLFKSPMRQLMQHFSPNYNWMKKEH